MSKKTTQVSLSYESIDSAIDKLKQLKNEGYTQLDGVSCSCWHEMCNCECGSCCWDTCSCGSLKVTK